jgi:hypothetical protein
VTQKSLGFEALAFSRFELFDATFIWIWLLASVSPFVENDWADLLKLWQFDAALLG